MDKAALKRGKEIANHIIKLDKAITEIESIDEESYNQKELIFKIINQNGGTMALLTPLIPENMREMLTDLIADSLLTEKLLLEKELELL